MEYEAFCAEMKKLGIEDVSQEEWDHIGRKYAPRTAARFIKNQRERASQSEIRKYEVTGVYLGGSDIVTRNMSLEGTNRQHVFILDDKYLWRFGKFGGLKGVPPGARVKAVIKEQITDTAKFNTVESMTIIDSEGLNVEELVRRVKTVNDLTEDMVDNSFDETKNYLVGGHVARIRRNIEFESRGEYTLMFNDKPNFQTILVGDNDVNLRVSFRPAKMSDKLFITPDFDQLIEENDVEVLEDLLKGSEVIVACTITSCNALDDGRVFYNATGVAMVCVDDQIPIEEPVQETIPEEQPPVEESPVEEATPEDQEQAPTKLSASQKINKLKEELYSIYDMVGREGFTMQAVKETDLLTVDVPDSALDLAIKKVLTEKQ